MRVFITFLAPSLSNTSVQEDGCYAGLYDVHSTQLQTLIFLGWRQHLNKTVRGVF